jgi:anti-sigma factor RsiW
MSDCQRIDSLVTPFVDGELPAGDREVIARHLRVCAPCASRVAAEQAVRDVIHRNKPAFETAPGTLRTTCARLAGRDGSTPQDPSIASAGLRRAGERTRLDRTRNRTTLPWHARLAPVALAASLVVIVGAAFLYEATERSAKLMAAELTADHVKCLAINSMLRTQHAPAVVEGAMLAGFGWQMHLPDNPERIGLELVGVRPCLYGEGKVAHIMYRHDGRLVSLFMLPNSSRSSELVKVLGHEAAIWCVGRRTFVLLAREPREEMERMAAFVQAGLQ